MGLGRFLDDGHEKLGDDVGPQVLRRTCGTALSDAGVPVASAVAYLGHSVEVNHEAYVKARRMPSSATPRRGPRSTR